MSSDTHRLLHVTTVPMSFTFLRGQAGFMRERGIEMAALSSPGPEMEAFAAEEGVAVHAVEMPRRVTPFRDVLALWKIRRVIRNIRPDIVHAHTPKGGLLGMLAARMEGVPHRIYHMRGLPFLGASGRRRALLRRSEASACGAAHRVLCVSHGIRDIAVAEGLCPPEKITVPAGGSGQGVDVDRFDPERQSEAGSRSSTRARFGIPEAAVVVGFVGRLVRDKGIVELEVAWRTVRAAEPDAHLLLVGPWEAQDRVPEEVRRTLEEDPRVHLAGEDWDTPPLYAAMDLVVLPTYREGFPNVPLEAAAMGLPVVATDIPGCVEAVEDGVTGTLVPPQEAEPLAAEVLDYLKDPQLRRERGVAGRDRVERLFRREVVWEAIYEEYRSLLARSA